MVSLMVVAQERMLMVLMPPEALPHQPITLALLQASPKDPSICVEQHIVKSW